MVEAFSLRGLASLAESWKQDPPFPGDNAFGHSLDSYRGNIIRRYAALANEQGLSSIQSCDTISRSWALAASAVQGQFPACRPQIDQSGHS